MDGQADRHGATAQLLPLLVSVAFTAAGANASKDFRKPFRSVECLLAQMETLKQSSRTFGGNSLSVPLP